MSGKRRHIKLTEAFRCAGSGIVQTVKAERNIKIELACAACAVVVSAALALEPVEWALIVVLIVLVLGLELANSAVESLVDLASPDAHPLARHAKDAMAGAVLVVAAGAAASGLLIFIHAALRLGGSL
jgi:diacylglycerol kinase